MAAFDEKREPPETDRDARQKIVPAPGNGVVENVFDLQAGRERKQVADAQGPVARRLAYNASPRISRGWLARGATPSRMTLRRSGPMRSIA